MLFFFRNSLLHEAIIQRDVASVRKLMHDPILRKELNHWGYTPFEMANFLGVNEIADLLCRPYQTEILVQLKGAQKPRLFPIQEIEKIFHFTYRPHLLFRNMKEFIRTINACPYLLKIGKFGEENRLLGREMRGSLSRGAQAKVSVRWIDPIFGYGLFCEEKLTEGQYIGEYSGLIRPVNRLISNINDYCFHYPTRFFSLWPYLVIDSEKEGNLMRFLNHSDEPNLRPVCLVDRGLLHLCFFANREIAQGEELTFNYGNDYWRTREKS